MEIKNFFSQQLTGQVIANPQVFVSLGNPFVGTSTGPIQCLGVTSSVAAASSAASAATSASQANAVLTAASPLRISPNSTITNGSGGNTGDLTLVSLNIPSNYPILGDSFSIEAFGLQQQASPLQIINGLIATITEVRPFFSGTLG